MADEQHVSTQPPQRMRRRAKVACRPCRDRKRKCDGRHPCGTCTQFEYECHYHYAASSPRARNGPLPETASSQRQRRRVTPEEESSPLDEPVGGGEDDHHAASASASASRPGRRAPPDATQSHLQSVEANSGAAFVRRLGLKIDPSNAPRLRLFGWNTGERLAGCAPGTARPITSILSYATMMRLARVYFDTVAVVYGFIDQTAFYERLGDRWDRGPAVGVDDYDQVLCGVAALGLHFSPAPPPSSSSTMEPDLVESAKIILERNTVLQQRPTIDTVAGWILRVAYLRMTSTPHVTWLASCSLMHVAEAAGIHREEETSPSSRRSIFDERELTTSGEAIGVDTRRRLWAMAQHLNIWASFDLGRTKITLPNATTQPLATRPGDPTTELLGLMPLTEVLDPNQTRSAEDLESDLSQLLDRTFYEPPVVMGQINLVLCIYRRLRSQRSSMLSRHVEKILSLARRAMDAARTMVARHCPWHHAANIPFQVVCLLLAVDSPASLEMMGEALAVLRQVRDTWSSPAMHEAYDTAYLLVRLHQRRKDEDARVLRAALDFQALAAPPPLSERDEDGVDLGGLQQTPGPAMFSVESLGLDDLFTSVPGLREFDLDQFLVEYNALNPQDLGNFGTQL